MYIVYVFTYINISIFCVNVPIFWTKSAENCILIHKGFMQIFVIGNLQMQIHEKFATFG